MAAKKKTEEVSIVEAKQHSDTVTDLQVLIKDKVIGEVYKDEESRQFQITYANDRKGAAVSVEDAVQAIIAQYNLHK